MKPKILPGKFLKEMKPSLKVIAVEPEESAVISGGKMGPHLIQGMGAGFIPEVLKPALDEGLLDEVVPVHSNSALSMARMLPRKFGIAVGISAGAVFEAAVKVRNSASRSESIIISAGAVVEAAVKVL
jgi:cysteine synthase